MNIIKTFIDVASGKSNILGQLNSNDNKHLPILIRAEKLGLISVVGTSYYTKEVAVQ